MLGFVKNKINSFLFNRIESYLKQKFTSGNKWGVSLPYTSWFELPMDVEGGNKIIIGDYSSIGKMAWLGAFSSYLPGDTFQPSIKIGNQVRIGNYACIVSVKSVEIEDNTLISEYFYVSDHGHGYNPILGIPPAKQPLEVKGEGVRIGKNCFIGYRVTILPGVILGNNCVVGSHSVVTKSFPNYSMIAGVPAKLIKKYDAGLNDWVSV
ncbi:acyltransferase [Hymenobacter swuensis]|uniref:acyltransferase n=1 Tax=Hymenobacter swuensis TaxID=1446467 RepID=UPI0009DE898C|nr:acyltransferase [Hymenobacter swuensis]